MSYCREWADVDNLDWDTLEALPTQHVTPAAERRQPDTLWRVRYRDRQEHMVVIFAPGDRERRCGGERPAGLG